MTINPATSADAANNYNVIVSGTCSDDTSSNVSLTINGVPTITSAPTNKTICSGSSTSFSVTATGAGLTYQWRKGSTNLTNTGNISGATSSTLTINPATSSDAATTYNVIVSGTCSPSDTSSNASLTVNTVTAITTAPTNQTVCSGSSAGFTVTAAGTALTYQWRKGNTNLTNTGNISGATSASLTINPATSADAATTYNVIVSGTCSNDTSSNVSLTINGVPTITTAPTNKTICSGNSTGFTVTATGAGLTYQWRKGNTNLTNTGNISGATSSSLTINPATSADAANNYNVIVSGTCSPSDTSSNVSLTVNTAPVITAGPANQSVCLGSSANFTVTATGTGLTYQWRKGSTNLTNTGNISGATSASLTINPATIANAASNYNVIVSGTCSPSDTSSNVSLTVNTAPAITTGPTNQTVCSGSSANFTVTATGTGLTYQWRKGSTDLTNTGNISGATSASLTINPATIADAANNYNVIVSGTCSSDTSSNVSLTINTAPVITVNPFDETVCIDGSTSFTVKATGSGLTYQWRKGSTILNNAGKISGATSATLIITNINALDEATDYNVIVSGTCSPADTSANASLTVNSPAAIVTPPANQTVCEGSAVSLTVGATGSGLTYQWRKGTTNIVNGGNISGANTATLVLNPVTLADEATNYNVLINGSCSQFVSTVNVYLMVNAKPRITTQPATQSGCIGGSETFWVVAQGTSISYQWRRGTTNIANGGNISGANTSHLIINPIDASDTASDYNVIVSGICAPSDTSDNAGLHLCDANTGIAGAESTADAVTIYPNPFNVSLNITLSDVSQMNKAVLKMYNVLGEEVMNIAINKEVSSIETNHLPSGIYIYRVICNNKIVQSGKLISQQL